MAISRSLYTKDQLEIIMRSWECSEPIPGKQQVLIVVWPMGHDAEIAIVKKTELKSDYGKRLYEVSMGRTDELYPSLRA